MTNFLEELYYGNVDPQARGYRKGSHILKVSENINELEEKLTERLSGEEKEAVPRFLQRLRRADGRYRTGFIPRRLPTRCKNDF